MNDFMHGNGSKANPGSALGSKANPDLTLPGKANLSNSFMTKGDNTGAAKPTSSSGSAKDRRN